MNNSLFFFRLDQTFLTYMPIISVIVIKKDVHITSHTNVAYIYIYI